MIMDNKVDLLRDYGVLCTFNVVDLKPYFAHDKLKNLRTNSFLQGKDDILMEDQQGELLNSACPQDIKATTHLMLELQARLYFGLTWKKVQLCWLIS